jgi:hypothetical protein
MNLFYAATKILVGNGAPWLEGEKPKDITPLIFMSSKRKNWNVKTALHNNEWVAKIEGTTEFNYDNVVQFVKLWTKIDRVHLYEDIEDNISWTLTANGQYSAASAYKAQFFGAISTNMNTMVWKVWAPPKPSPLLGSLSRIGYGWRIDWKRECGQIVAYVLYAREP